MRYGAGYGSQEAFAQAARMHVTYVGSIERGERNLSLRNLVRIAEALGMTPSRLLAEAEEKMRRDGPPPCQDGP